MADDCTAKIIDALRELQTAVQQEFDGLLDQHDFLPATWLGGATVQHHRYHAAAMAMARCHTMLEEKIRALGGFSGPTRSSFACFSGRHPDMRAYGSEGRSNA